jgi:hypothetical protein
MVEPLPPGGAVATVELPRAADTLLVGAARTVSATLRDASGAPVAGGTVVWRSSDTTVVRATAGASPGTAVVRAVGRGVATLVATSGSRAGPR